MLDFLNSDFFCWLLSIAKSAIDILLTDTSLKLANLLIALGAVIGYKIRDAI